MINKNVTIDDVAKLAGVSIATVSRALHKPAVVSEKTRDKVNTAVAQTGYTQNAMARNLRLDRTGMVVVLVPDISNPFFSEILSGIEFVATREGYNILIGNTNNDPAREHIYANYVRSNLADGILLLNGHVPVDEADFGKNGSGRSFPPMVALCERIPGLNYPSVLIDNVSASKIATEYLIDLGHKDIVHVAGPADNILTKDRRTGFFVALEEAGIIENQDRIYYGDFSIESGKQVFAEIMKRQPKPTAVFCANDEMAMGVISAAREAGFDLPNDLSVVGFDDIQFSESFHPSLTTIHQPRRQIGAVAMEQLVDLLANPEAEKDKVTILDSKLMIRESATRI